MAAKCLEHINHRVVYRFMSKSCLPQDPNCDFCLHYNLKSSRSHQISNDEYISQTLNQPCDYDMIFL